MDDALFPVSVGEKVFIPIGGIHRVENDGTENLIIIETQLGVRNENDIERLEDDYGRS